MVLMGQDNHALNQTFGKMVLTPARAGKAAALHLAIQDMLLRRMANPQALVIRENNPPPCRTTDFCQYLGYAKLVFGG